MYSDGSQWKRCHCGKREVVEVVVFDIGFSGLVGVYQAQKGRENQEKMLKREEDGLSK